MRVLKQTRTGGTLIAVVAWLVLAAAPGWAQVEQVVADAVNGDIDCLPCAATIELALRKLPGVDKVSVSMSKQIVTVTYKPGGIFQPQALRDGIGQAEVRVARWHISARGTARRENGKVYFTAGKNRFVVLNPKLPLNIPLQVDGVAKDAVQPYELIVDDFKPAA